MTRADRCPYVRPAHLAKPARLVEDADEQKVIAHILDERRHRAGGSQRSGVRGELLATAAQNAGCLGVVVDGAVRDVARMRQMDFRPLPAAPRRTTARTGSGSSTGTCLWRSPACSSRRGISSSRTRTV